MIKDKTYPKSFLQQTNLAKWLVYDYKYVQESAVQRHYILIEITLEHNK